MNEKDQQGLELKRRSYELSILNDVARTLNGSVDLRSLLESALAKVAELLGFQTGWVLLLDEASGEPYLAAEQNLPPGFHREPEQMAGWCYCLEAFCAGDLSGAENVGVITCSRLRKLALAQGDTAGLRYHASVPLKIHDAGTISDEVASKNESYGGLKRLGMLNVAFPEWRQLAADELELLRTIGDMLSVAVERARLHARALDAAQAEERNRLAREIHDTIAQDFSAIAFQLEAADALLVQQAEPARVRKNITAALDLARQGLEQARRSVFDLRAAPLEGRTLLEALAALTEEANAKNDLRVSFEAAPIAQSLPPAVEVGLYRIAEEALQNALRHAGAAQVTIRLEALHDRIRLTVQDDGRGFNMEGISPGLASGRFGLVGMRERTRLLGGNFRIESTPGTGTRITAEVHLAVQPLL